MMLLYRLITLYLVIHIGVVLFKSEKWTDQLAAGLLIVPLLLRVLLIR